MLALTLRHCGRLNATEPVCTAVSGLGRESGLLRQMESRRSLLRFQSRRWRYLGVERDHGPLRSRQANTISADHWAAHLLAPAPSPDGKRVYVVGEQPRGELLKYDPRLKQFVRFLGGISAGELDFSPDGGWVTYVSYPDLTLWRSRMDGSERLQLTFPPMRAALPEMVAKRKRDRVHRNPEGKDIQDLCGVTTGWSSARVAVRESWRS